MKTWWLKITNSNEAGSEGTIPPAEALVGSTEQRREPAAQVSAAENHQLHHLQIWSSRKTSGNTAAFKKQKDKSFLSYLNFYDALHSH